MAGGIDEVEFVFLSVAGAVEHACGGGFDGDAFFALEVHGVEDLFGFFAVGDGAGAFEEAVGEGRLAVVDMGDDAEVADVGLVHGSSVREGGRTGVGAARVRLVRASLGEQSSVRQELRCLGRK